MGSKAATATAPDASTFARRLVRLEQVNHLLRGCRREMTQLLIAERQQKAEIYLAHMHVSHGERQGIASAETKQIATEILQLKGNIDVLEDEQHFLEFCITYDVGE